VFDFDCWLHQSAVAYIFIGYKTQLFDTDKGKSFQNKLNLKSYSDSICSKKIGYFGILNRMVPFLRLQLRAPIFFVLAP
jgi:hypothetical protein